MAVNVIAITGNLTRDGELKMTQGGNTILTFTVAVNNRRKQGNEWVDDPAFVPCVMFGQRAQSVSQHMRKGLKVGVNGRISESRWQDSQTGQRRSRLEVIVSDLDFMAQRGAGQGGSQTSSQPAPSQGQAYQPAPAPTTGPVQGRLTGADDVPFY